MEKTEKIVWGWETQLDLHDCNVEMIDDEAAVQRYARELVVLIDMVPYGEPMTPRFGFACPATAGLSLTQLLETSLLSAHFSPSTQCAFINIFSCKIYNPETVRDFSIKFFGAKDCTLHFLERY